MFRYLVIISALASLTSACVGIDDETTTTSSLTLDAEADWAQSGRSPRHTAWNPHEVTITAATVPDLRVLWTCCETGRRTEVALWQGQLFVTNPAVAFESPERRSYVSAFDVDTGALHWRSPLGQAGELGGVGNRPAVGYGRLHAQDENRSFTLDTGTGVRVPGLSGLPGWDIFSSSPVASGRVVYLDIRNVEAEEPEPRQLLAVDDDGATQWIRAVPGRRIREPAIANDRIWTSTSDRQLQAFDLADGSPLWATPDAGDVIGSPAISAGRVLAVVHPNTVVAYRETTGALLWSTPFTGGVVTPNPVPAAAPAVDAQRVYVAIDKAAGGIAVGAFDAATGARHWGVIVGASRRTGLLAVAGGVLYVAAADGQLHALDAATGRTLITLSFPSAVRSPIIGGGRLIVPTDGHGVAVFGL
jgi:outer membrane protein assembly factor BamB